MRRRLLYILVSAGLLGVAFAFLTLPASAGSWVVTCPGGASKTVTADSAAAAVAAAGGGGCSAFEVTVEAPAVPGAGKSDTPEQATDAQQGAGRGNASPEESGGAEQLTTRSKDRVRLPRRTLRPRKAQPQRQARRRSARVRRRRSSGGIPRPRLRRPGGAPTRANPGFVDALPGPSRATGVPNFVIRKFRVPIFLLPIYQAAGINYGIRWEVLAAINEIESDYGRNLNVSSAGAMGWMQFLPSTWRMYGVDANKDGKKDPYNPVDAIFAAGRYLKAAGGERDLKKAIFAYNHADWYVDSVLMRAKLIAGIPEDLTSSLTGLTEARFPVYARAKYADDLSERDAKRRFRRGQNPARVVSGNEDRRGINIFARKGAPAVAVNDGMIKKIGFSSRLGRYLILQDVYGNSYTYANLESVSRYYPVPKDPLRLGKLTKADTRALRSSDARPRRAASAGRQTDDSAGAFGRRERRVRPRGPRMVKKKRLFAHPLRPNAYRAGGREQLKGGSSRARRSGAPLVPGFTTFRNYFSRPIGLNEKDFRLKRMRRGARVIGGTILGRVGDRQEGVDPHLYFEIRPAGRGAPRIDPKPILDGWKLLEATAIYRASGRNVLYGSDGVSIGQILLLPKPLLERRVLADERIDIYPCGRRDIRGGEIDRRVLATMAYLAESGMRPNVTSLKCGHSVYTSSGGVSHHASGNAVDIAQINGIPILGHQERGGITERAVRRLMRLQGTVQPDQIISLLDLGGPTLKMADHHDHIHVGFRPLFGSNRKLGKQAMAVLKPRQWHRLLDRLREIENPVVRRKPSRFALPARPGRASRAHRGE